MPYDRSPIYFSPRRRHKDMKPTKETKKASDENENEIGIRFNLHSIVRYARRRTWPPNLLNGLRHGLPPYIILFGLLFFIPTSRTMDSTFYYPNDNRIESHWTSFDLT